MIGLPKPAPRPKRHRTTWRKRKTIADRRAEVEVIKAVHEEVFRLDPRCVMCLRGEAFDDEMHEILSRAMTRGLPPAQRFNRQNCVRLCQHCHHAITHHRAEIGFLLPVYGADGGVISQWRGETKAMVYRRGHPPEFIGPGRVWRRQWWPA